MILYPAIDLKDGNAVRLLRGDMDKSTVFNTDPAAQAMAFVEQDCEWQSLAEGSQRHRGAATAFQEQATHTFV